MKDKTIVAGIILLSLCLNVVGITWGLPDRWNVDEVVASALKMAHNRQITPEGDTTHPTFYHFFLMVFLGLYILFLKFTGYPLSAAVSSASVSWINFVNTDPFLASSLYIVARTVSALLGAGMVFIVYLITKRIYGRRAGLFSALILTLSAGFIADNHYAKSSALVNFLSVFAVYFCIKAVYDDKFRRDFLIASLLGGLALATKFNGGIVVLPLITAYLYHYAASHPYNNSSVSYCLKYIRNLISSGMVLRSLIFYLLGFFIGFPAIFLHFARYVPSFIFYKKNYFIGYSSFGVRIINFLHNIIAYIHLIADMYGVFLFLIVFYGLVIAIRNKNQGKSIILSLIIPYFLIMSSSQILKYPNAKYIILIIPFLSIFGGLFVNRLIESQKIARGLKYLFLSAGLTLSFIYAASTEMIFIKEDIRYLTTRWIEENIPHDSSIEIFSELDWYFSSRLLKEYNVVFFGTDSKNAANTSQFKVWNDDEKVKEYFRELNIKGPKSDFLILSSVDFIEDIFKNLREEERTIFLNNLIKGKWGYAEIKRISYDDKAIFSHIIDYTPRYILILKKTGKH
ncbi:MAG: glycosyltransferase family 39 protein [Candidatus Omnitrophota bacterium]|nr:glycosyltransferase family 39 protein [Candidatus Omnitrophota bacterium]